MEENEKKGEISDKQIEAYALDNAISHNGKSQAGSVLNSLFAEGLERNQIKDIMPKINEIVSRVNLISLEEQKAKRLVLGDIVKEREQKKQGELSELEGAKKGDFVVRFAPFPSGPLHIGNTRQLVLNDEYAKKYNGKLILVLDDTIGSEEKPIEPEAYKLIPEGIDWMKVKYDPNIIYKSDRLEIYYKYAEELIEKDKMYVCSCNQEDMRENRAKGIECGCRQLPIKEQLKRWKKMFSSKEGEFTARLKTNMQDPNPAFRDRVMFRISDRIHPRVKDKYRVWPLLEFSWAIDDHLLEITHIIRGMDLMMETQVEEYIWDIFSWKKPLTTHTGFFQIEGVKISKSKGSKEVKAGVYIGWNDPRTWSLQALKDRGFLPEAIRDFCKSMGLTKSNSIVAVDVLYSINKKYLEDVPRYFFVQDPVKINIKDAPELRAELPLHPSKDLGKRVYKTGQEFYITKQDYDSLKDGNYRLMHLLNFSKEKLTLTKEENFRYISEHPDAGLKTKIIHWVSEDNIKVDIRMPDNSIISGLGESDLLKLKKGTILQFERFGFCKLYSLNKNKKYAEFWFAHK